MTKNEEFLKEALLACEQEKQRLREELSFLMEFPAVAQGLKGEDLVARYTGGIVTGHKDSHDVVIKDGARIEVKFSRLNTQAHKKTKRWNWIRPLGQNESKEYDWLVLMGDKDPRYEEQYPVELPYVFFMIPRNSIDDIRSNGKLSVALNTNLATAKAPQSVALKRYLVRSATDFKELLASCELPNMR